MLGTAHILLGGFCRKSKIYQPCCALGAGFGPGPSGVYSRLGSRDLHHHHHHHNNIKNINNNNNNDDDDDDDDDTLTITFP